MAINHDVSQERVATALNVPVRVVKAVVNLLAGIHEDVAEMLKDKNISPGIIKLLRRVNGVRQIAIAELMVASDNYTNGYVEALILGTPPDQRVKPAVAKKRKGFSRETIGQLQEEMATLERDFKAVEAGYGQKVLHLTLASTYIRSLLNIPVEVRFPPNRPAFFCGIRGYCQSAVVMSPQRCHEGAWQMSASLHRRGPAGSLRGGGRIAQYGCPFPATAGV